MSERPDDQARVATPAPIPAPPQHASAPRSDVATIHARPAADVVPSDATRSTLEDVALRMERIKASAAAIRQAIETEAQRVATSPEPTPAPTAAAAPRPVVVAQHGRVANEQPARAPSTLHDDDDDGLPEPAVVRPLARTSASGAFETRTDDFESAFLGGDEDFSDDDELADPGSSASQGDLGFAPAARPIPWTPILAAAGVLVALGLFLFREQLFPSAPEPAPAGDVAEVRPGAVTPPENPEPVADPQAGKPTTPEIQPAGTPPVPAAGTVPPGTTPPAAVPPGTAPAAAVPPGTAAAVPPGTAPAAAVPPGTNPAASAPTTPGGATPAATTPVPPAGTSPAAPAGPPSAKLDEARALYTAAKGGSKRKKLEQARTLLQEILAASPREGQALLLLAQIELELGDAKSALATATSCTEAAAELADCWLTIGVLQQDKNDKAAAAAAYEKYLALAPDGRYAGDVRKQLARLKK